MQYGPGGAWLVGVGFGNLKEKLSLIWVRSWWFWEVCLVCVSYYTRSVTYKAVTLKAVTKLGPRDLENSLLAFC